MKSAAGFTLIELLACLSILAIVLCIGIPFSSSLYKKNQLDVITQDVKNAIHLAKVQALASGQPLMLTHLPNSNDWALGMQLRVDNATHQLLREWQWHSTGLQMFWHGFQSKDYLIFTSDISRSTVNGFFLIKSNSQQVKLIVNRMGRVSINGSS